MRFWIVFATGAFLASMLALGAHKISVNMIEAKHKKDMAAQAVEIGNQCSTAKNTTERISHDLQKDFRSDDADYATAISKLPLCPGGTDWTAGMVPPTARGHDAAAAGNAVAAGIARAYDPQRVTGIVRKGQKYQKQLRACQQYARDVKAAATASGKKIPR